MALPNALGQDASPDEMWECVVDFIEKILGWSPDNGEGWFEYLLFAIPLCGIWMIWRHRRAQGRAARAPGQQDAPR